MSFLWDQLAPFPVALAQFLSTSDKVEVVDKREDLLKLRGVWGKSPGNSLRTVRPGGVVDVVLLDNAQVQITWDITIDVVLPRKFWGLTRSELNIGYTD